MSNEYIWEQTEGGASHPSQRTLPAGHMPWRSAARRAFDEDAGGRTLPMSDKLRRIVVRDILRVLVWCFEADRGKIGFDALHARDAEGDAWRIWEAVRRLEIDRAILVLERRLEAWELRAIRAELLEKDEDLQAAIKAGTFRDEQDVETLFERLRTALRPALAHRDWLDR